MFVWKEAIIQEATFSLATTLADAGAVLVDGVELVWDLAIGNPMLLFLLGCTLISFGFSTFRKAKRVIR